MNFIEKILDGFNKVLEFLGNLFAPLFDLLAKGFTALLDIITKPLSLLFHLLEGIFYFITQLFQVVIVVVKIFTALFQFVGALFLGIFRTIKMWLIPDLTGTTHFPSATGSGFQTVIDLLMPTGLMTVVPMVAIAFVWFFFVVKIIGLFGGQIMINPLGRGGR